MAGLSKNKKTWPIIVGVAAVVFVFMMFLNMPKGGTAAPTGIPGENGWDENVYKSEFLGLSFTLPEGWERWDERKLGEASAGNAEGAERERIRDTYIMWAGQSEQALAVYLQAAQVSGSRTTEEAGEEMRGFYEKMEGVTVQRLEDTVIAGETYYGLSLLAENAEGDGGAAQQYLFIRMQDDYAVSVSLAGKPESKLLWILDQFKSWKPA